MTWEKIDNLSQKIVFIAVAFGALALLLVCMGIGTPKWESSYTSTGGGLYALANTGIFSILAVLLMVRTIIVPVGR